MLQESLAGEPLVFVVVDTRGTSLFGWYTDTPVPGSII